MFFGLVTRNPHGYPELCLVAEKPSAYSQPIPILTLLETDYAVHLVSNEEAVTVSRDSSDNAYIITVIRPAKLYLTPNLPERPGYSVNAVKVKPINEILFDVHFDRDRGWENWHPNVRLY